MADVSVLRAMTGALAPLQKAAVGRVEASEFGWTPVWFGGGHPETDFQHDIHRHRDTVLANWAVFSCVTLIASDIGKLCLKLVEKQGEIWVDSDSPAFSPVLKKPNAYQTRQKFIEQWMTSKLLHGNAYILKERDNRQVVVGLYVLDPHRCTPLVVPETGEVFYRLSEDDLAGVRESVVVPASEIIHDTMVCLFHPLCGISPIYANALAAMQGLSIQKNYATFFKNLSMPSGILSTEDELSTEQAAEYRARWQENYGGGKIGKVAVLGGGLKYQGITTNAVDSQVVEQLKLTAEMVCSTFHVPAFKIGAGTIPAGQKVEDLTQIYYTDCLQSLMESIEALLDEGLGISKPVGTPPRQLGTMFELDDLLKMDQTTMTAVLKEQVGAGITKLDEARARLGYEPLPEGGDTSYLQQQNYSVSALAKRDASADPFAAGKAPAAPPPAASAPAPAKDFELMRDGMLLEFRGMVERFEASAADRERIAAETRAREEAETLELETTRAFADALIRRFAGAAADA